MHVVRNVVIRGYTTRMCSVAQCCGCGLGLDLGGDMADRNYALALSHPRTCPACCATSSAATVELSTMEVVRRVVRSRLAAALHTTVVRVGPAASVAVVVYRVEPRRRTVASTAEYG